MPVLYKIVFSLLILFYATCASAISHEKFSQLFGKTLIVGFEGESSKDKDVQQLKQCLEQGLVQGIILFRHNIKSPEQLKSLIAYLNPEKKILVMVDQEGGKVRRLDSSNGFDYEFPSAKSYQNADEVFQAFKKMGEILKETGINMDLAPVLDIDHQPPSPIVGQLDRSFSTDPQKVKEYGEAAIQGLKKSHVLSCAKHYPGHGSASGDSHLGWVDVTHDWSSKELFPFEALKNQLPCILVAHTFNQKLDPVFPASLSSGTYHLLKNYKGVFITDDYFMAAIAQKYTEAEFAIGALNAGSTWLIFSQHPKLLELLKKPKKPVQDFVIDLHSQAYQLYLDHKISLKILEKRANKSNQMILKLKNI